jgi:hypothetical protein
MNHCDENIQPSSPEGQVDLLVDGELSEAERRDLLLQLEHEPDGWRRCALAFLEAQCWKSGLGEISRETMPVGQASPDVVRPIAMQVDAAVAQAESPAQPMSRLATPLERADRWQRARHLTATMLMTTASFLIALMIGMNLHNWTGVGPHTPDTSIVQPVKQDVPLKNPAGSWEMVTLAANDSPDGRAQTYCVPAQRRDSLDQRMLDLAPDAISPEMRQLFEQSGHRVVQKREIVPVQLEDGRRLVVPVDNVEIHYVGRPSY